MTHDSGSGKSAKYYYGASLITLANESPKPYPCHERHHTFRLGRIGSGDPLVIKKGCIVAQEDRGRPSASIIIANLAGWIFIEGVTRGQYSLVVSVTFDDKL